MAAVALRFALGVIFRGGDDGPYEVRGEQDGLYNILSSPRLSVNARFATVPSKFPTLAVGDTVMVDLGVALCAEKLGPVHLLVDAPSGNISLAGDPDSSLARVGSSRKSYAARPSAQALVRGSSPPPRGGVRGSR